jgi:Arc/MetJ-type ribon-helix-helix transcriptional regulator
MGRSEDKQEPLRGPMNADITPENEHFLEHAVAVGMFHDRGEAINTAIALLKHRAELIRDVNAGIEQLEQGYSEPADVEEIMSAIDVRLEAQSQ